MIRLQDTGKTETFVIPIPRYAADGVPNRFHQISLNFSATCNDGMTATVAAKCLDAGAAEAVTGGEIDAFANADGTKTRFINYAILEEITVTIAGRTAGTVGYAYVGYGDADRGPSKFT